MGSSLQNCCGLLAKLVSSGRNHFTESISLWRALFLLLLAAHILVGGFFVAAKIADLDGGHQLVATSSLFVGRESQASATILPVYYDLVTLNGVRQVALPYLPSGRSLGTILEPSAQSITRSSITEYTVQAGDTLSGIAQKFGLQLGTLTAANNLTSKAILQSGLRLIILPVDGVLHHVAGGESIGYLAKLYEAEQQAISAFNNLDDHGEIFIGDLLIIPGGKAPKSAPVYANQPVANNYFICPLGASCRVTQGLHWYNAIDLGNGSCNDPIYAAAGGQVQRAGNDRIAGIYARILHSSGIVTFYGHMSSVAVTAGQQVSQGELIGYVGHTGYTIPAGPGGCHLHFEVRGAANPFAN